MDNLGRVSWRHGNTYDPGDGAGGDRDWRGGTVQ